MNVAILGSGKIGCDLLMKVLRNKLLRCVLFCGRREDSPGISFAKKQQIATSTQGLSAILSHDQVDLVFDATSASAHLLHYPALKEKNIPVINLTPAPIGQFIVPSIDTHINEAVKNISLITCGGQTSIPIIHAIANCLASLSYIEVITTIAAKSAGSATRKNISEYQDITETAIAAYSGCNKVKSILVINPAVPPITMQTTIYMLAKHYDLANIKQVVEKTVAVIQAYLPGYQLIAEPVMNNDRLVIMVKVTGNGDYLPSYAGNLDIITSSAIRVAEMLACREPHQLALAT